MRKYLHKFETTADFEAAYYGSDYHEPWVSLTKSNIPLKIKILLPEEQELILNYIEKALVTISDNTEEMYIWQVENSTSGWISVGNYIATDTIEENEYVGRYINNIRKDSGDQEWHSTDGYSFNELIVINGPKDKLDYNKRFNGDLIVDYAQAAVGGEGRWHNGCRIVFAAPNICAEETSYNEYNGYYYNFNEPSVACAHGNKDTLRVRILNLKDTPIDIDLPVDERSSYYVYRDYSFNDPTMSVNTMRLHITEGSGSPCWGTIDIGEAV